MQRKKIAIIGSGWYGCHLASSLSKRNTVHLFEKNSSIFEEASLKNQNRLHLGFHYPRSFITREQSKRGYKLFLSSYPKLIKTIDMNIYAIAEGESLMDFKTYCSIMSASRLEWKEVTKSLPINLNNIDGALACNEYFIDSQKAKSYFQKVLKCKIDLKNKITPEEINKMSNYFDIILDCTWNKLFLSNKFFYEPCIVFTYVSSLGSSFALTLMDGNLFSLYPFTNKKYTLTHVKYTPLGQFNNLSEAQNAIDNIKLSEINELRLKSEKHVLKYFPSFKDYFSSEGHFFSMKTKKINSMSDDRSTFITKQSDNVYSVHSGKIDTIFDIEHQVKKLII